MFVCFPMDSVERGNDIHDLSTAPSLLLALQDRKLPVDQMSIYWT